MDKKNTIAAPRLLLAGTASGTGKTTVTCAVLQLLVSRQYPVAALKCGPDYIDPMFHREAIGAKAGNLDLFLSGEEGVRFLLAKNSRNCRVSILEGVMGYFDGLSFDSDEASSCHIARLTGTPAVLVVNVRGMGRSLAALLRGFWEESGGTLRGVIFNHCSPGMYPSYRRLAESLSIPCYGYLPPLPEASLESRHLGLVTAEELPDLRKKLDILGRAAEETLDLDGLLRLADSAPPLCFQNLWEKVKKRFPVRLGVAKDRAFCFRYEDQMELFSAFGAELVPFSPLQDAGLPEGLDGLYLCGGYPEEYCAALSGNRSMRESIRRAVEGGLPTLAECGGFMYLLEKMAGKDGISYPMVGALPGSSFMTKGLTRFGYKMLTARGENLLCRAGEQLPCHEFHYSDSTNNGDGFSCTKRGKTWECIHTTPSLLAGYPHFHLGCHPTAMERFLQKCQEYRTHNNR